MLKVAFNRRLIFKVGISEFFKQPNSVVWGDIPHKTTTTYGEFGYPDPLYLDDVTDALKRLGITAADVSPWMEWSPLLTSVWSVEENYFHYLTIFHVVSDSVILEIIAQVIQKFDANPLIKSQVKAQLVS